MPVRFEFASLAPFERASRATKSFKSLFPPMPKNANKRARSKMRADTAPTGTSTSNAAAAMGTVGGVRGVLAHAVGQQVGQPSQQQQQQPNTLPLEVWLVNILPLTPLRDLLPLCSTTKWLGDELKHDVVIKAALARRGHAAQSLSIAMSLVVRDEIAMPSAMRLLRLTLGKKCEKLGQCERILTWKMKGPSERSLVAKNYGVFMCSECISCHLEKGTPDWTTMYVDRCGEICGPSSVPTMTLDDGMSMEVKRILSVFEKLNGTYVEGRRAKRERDAEVRASNQAKRAKKFTSIIESLRHNLRERDWIDIALATDDGGNLRSPIARKILGDFVKAPSKATSVAVSKASKQLREMFDYLYHEIRFHDFSAIQHFMDRDGRWDEEECTPYWLALKDELLRKQVWTKTPAEIYHHRYADLEMVKILKSSRGSRRVPVFYDVKRIEAIARLTINNGFGFNNVLIEAASRAVPLVPAHDYERRCSDMRHLFARLNDTSSHDTSEWKLDYDITIDLYKDLQRQMDRYVSLNWVFPVAKRERIRRKKDLMARIARVRNDFSSRRHLILGWLLDGSDFYVLDKERSQNGFNHLLSWHEASVRNAASQRPQRDIRLYF